MMVRFPGKVIELIKKYVLGIRIRRKLTLVGRLVPLCKENHLENKTPFFSFSKLISGYGSGSKWNSSQHCSKPSKRLNPSCCLCIRRGRVCAGFDGVQDGEGQGPLRSQQQLRLQAAQEKEGHSLQRWQWWGHWPRPVRYFEINTWNYTIYNIHYTRPCLTIRARPWIRLTFLTKRMVCHCN